MTENNSPLRVLIFGAGAIGTYIGCSLHRTGSEVVFIEKPAVAEELHRQGLHLYLPGEKIVIENPRIVHSIQDAVESGPYDIAVFALKSFDTLSAAHSMAAYKTSLPPILCLQNGVDNEVILASELGENQVIPGTVTSSILRRSAGNVALERQRGIGIASSHPLSVRLKESMNLAGLNARLFDRPPDMKWSKLITNLLSNAASAILDMTPAQIFSHPALFRLEIAQIREALAVMKAQDIRVVNLPGTPVRLLALLIEHFPPWLSKPLLQRSLGAGRGGKMPSLHMDLAGGRKNSEVNELNGSIVRYGQKLGFSTPTNQLLHQTLQQIINGEIPWSTFQKKPQALLDLWQPD